jgi:hypothetical protein
LLGLKKTDFIQLIHQPNLPSAKHITALKQVSADFPYFIHAKVLLAKALYQENHYEYDKFLKQAALVVPDREVLYHYLHYGQTALQAVMPNIAEEVKAVLPPLVVTESIETPPSHQEQVILQDIPVVEALPVSQIEEDSTLPSLIEAQLEKQEPTLVATTEPLVPHTELMVTSIEMEEEPQEIIEQAIILEAENVTPGLEVDIDASTGIEEQHPSSPETPALPLELTTVEAVETKLVAEPNESHSFMEWLNLAQGKKPVVKEPETTLEQPVNDLPTEPVKPVIEVTREDIERAVAKSNVNDFQNILDKFIKENPSISRPKAEFFNPVNMAKQSVEEDEELVTETLANLYYKQGNHKRAIRAYEKLCLIYPSKMTYFASLIQKIKSEIKD